MSRYERPNAPEGQHASALELFYDLVFVFAITQVSHLLLTHLSWEGAGQSLIVLLVVWWAWNYTTWVTNVLDPDAVVVRLVLIGLMLGSLLMAIAIPEAFGDRALLFAGAYVAIQVGRHLFLTFVVHERGSADREAAARILLWFCASGVFWLAGGFADDTARTVLWLIALAIDYSGPFLLYRIPGMRSMRPDDWRVGSEHFAERFQLFVIIALGESIVLTGATTSELDLDLARITAFGLAFLGTAALWWLYFNYVATILARRLALAREDRTTMARDAYTYLHAVIIAGIVLSAVGDEIVIQHPTEELPTAEVIAVAGGPALYLLAMNVLRLRMTRSISRPRLAGLVACLLAGLLGAELSGLALGAVLVAILIAVIVAEQVSSARRRARGEPAPHELLEARAASGA